MAGSSGRGVIDGAFTVLRALPTADSARQIAAITEATGIPRPTVHRLLNQLQQAGAVVHDGTRWSLAAGILQLASTADPATGLRDAAGFVVHELRAQTGATVSVVVRSDDQYIAIEMVPGRFDLPFTSRPGAALPPSTAAAEVLTREPMPGIVNNAVDDEAVIAGITCYATEIPLPPGHGRAALQVATAPIHHARDLAPVVDRAAALIARRVAARHPPYLG